MRDPMPKSRPAHILLVDMIPREISRYTCEKVDVALANRLGELHGFANPCRKFGSRWFLQRLVHRFAFHFQVLAGWSRELTTFNILQAINSMIVIAYKKLTSRSPRTKNVGLLWSVPEGLLSGLGGIPALCENPESSPFGME